MKNKTLIIEWFLLGIIFTINDLLLYIDFKNFDIYYTYAVLNDIFTWKFFYSLYPTLCGFHCMFFNIFSDSIHKNIKRLIFVPFFLASVPIILMIFTITFGIEPYSSPGGFVLLIVVFIRLRKHRKKFFLNQNKCSFEKNYLVNLLAIILVATITTSGIFKAVELFSDFIHFVPYDVILNTNNLDKSCDEIKLSMGTPNFKYMNFKNLSILIKNSKVVRKYSKNKFIQIGQKEDDLIKMGLHASIEIWIYSYIPYGKHNDFYSITFINGRSKELIEMWK